MRVTLEPRGRGAEGGCVNAVIFLTIDVINRVDNVTLSRPATPCLFSQHHNRCVNVPSPMFFTKCSALVRPGCDVICVYEYDCLHMRVYVDVRRDVHVIELLADDDVVSGDASLAAANGHVSEVLVDVTARSKRFSIAGFYKEENQ